MFTGIIETTGRIETVEDQGTNRRFRISSTLSKELKVDQSLAHNGVCLTVEALEPGSHWVTAVDETLSKTTLGNWNAGDMINLERCLPMNGRLDGHFVQGHVDATGTCIDKLDMHGSWKFRFQYPPSFAALVIEKGSISLNGISLTVFDVTDSEFSVAVIPYTYEHTNIQFVATGTSVNLEFDLIGKYLARQLGGMQTSEFKMQNTAFRMQNKIQ